MKTVAIDTETTGLDRWSPRTQVTRVSWWDFNGHGGILDPSVDSHATREEAVGYASSPAWTKLFFNAAFDIPMLEKIGIEVKGPVVDVMFMAKMAFPDERVHNLKHFARRFLGYTYEEHDRVKKWARQNKGKTIGQAPAYILEPYALLDAKATLELFYFLKPLIKEHGNIETLRREMKLLRQVTLPMEETGVRIDRDEALSLGRHMQGKVSSLVASMREELGDPEFNPNSHQQAVRAVYDGTVEPTTYTKSGAPAVNELALLKSPSEIGNKIVQFRKIAKAKNTYIKNILSQADDEDVLRVNFNQMGARTGRFSSSNPNLQNIPRPSEHYLGRIRNLFRCRPGCRLLFIDYEQIEIRLAAHYSEEEHLLHSIRHGLDLHSQACKNILGRQEDDPEWSIFRYLAKKLNFSMLYGVGAKKFADSILLDTEGRINLSLYEASNTIQQFKEGHPGIMRLFDRTASEVSATKGIRNHYGRYLPVDIRKPYIAVNYLIQSTAADLLKRAMLELMPKLRRWGVRLLMQIHDELVFEIEPRHREHVPEIVATMEERERFSVPISCSVEWGSRWGQKRPVPLETQSQ